KLVWEIFEKVFTATPRESKKEEKIRAALKAWVKEKAKTSGINVSIKEDETGNILLKKAATPGMGNKPSILLQGHLDMVCVTDRKDGFDFDNEPIPILIQDNGEWVEADETTLGADNGIGMALGLALMFHPDVEHGPLEVLATVDEETGLTGAFALDPKEMGIESKLLINIDSEDLGVITIGSAGGGDSVFTKQLSKDSQSDYMFRTLTVRGLLGGHSGVDIHLPRGNANKMIARMLSALLKEIPVAIVEWNGGEKRNAIARSSTIIFGVPSSLSAKAEELLLKEKSELLIYYRGGEKPIEPETKIDWSQVGSSESFTLDESKKIIQTIHMLPHGVIRFSPAVDGLVETSNNVAVLTTTDTGLRLQMSTRSNLDTELTSTRRKIAIMGEVMRWNVEQDKAYPGWAPDPTNAFLKYVRETYEAAIGSEIVVEAIHAGLECGILGAGIPGLRMISIGPTIKNAHSPDEKLKIDTVGTVFDFLRSILKDLPSTL
ncbi:MAG: beta-Ala-His dipeptidase, partial [Candidatus Thorarchaeota archaeon]|nr:beta-Ala-His dipeptidase [Candidatus Thorarchaeota archaeon]